MAPIPQEVPCDLGEAPRKLSEGLDENRVVISGVSGTYPQSHHIKDLSDILYNKVNPAEEKTPRWNYNHPEVPQHVGLIPDLDTFDAQFFRVHYHLGVNLDPMSRKILEHAYQAIYDAGVNPNQLSGKKVGVYIGSCLSETEKALFYAAFAGKTGFSIAGCSKTMFANRVSYWLNAKGPSLAIDGGCCSSAVALEQAYQALTRGDCEAAVVGGCNLCMHPQTSVHFSRNITLCMDGRTKSYDQAADGCVKSEAISVLFLQKAKDALRIYADVVFVKTAYVSVENTGSFKRKPEEMTTFLDKFYEEIKVSPRDVEFVEGFGAADFETDKIELDAIDKVFCRSRREPLYVGSIMSNVGYCESATGIMGVTKVLLGYHTGRLAGNLHCERPRDDVEALREGRLKILTDHKPTARTYVAINGLSLTGVNSHILLHGHYKPKDLTKYHSDIPRLVLISGRTDSAVQNIINNLKSRPIDAEELALIQNIHSYKINGHLGRGFTILGTDNESKTTSLVEKAEYFDGGERPLWFVYSGMGSQWAGMGTQLMRLPIFAAAIERCRRVLEPRGIDIIHIITSPDKTIYDNILHSFVGIAAVQIGLTDILLQLGLVPDKIIGHSVGELGCAYADGCLTAEEMILSAYSRGLVSVETPFIYGSMAAVGIGFTEVSKMCPPEIEVACHNAADSSTISGPAEIMGQFVAQLTTNGIFAKEVPCSNIAYHSRYIAEAGPGLLKYLKEVIKTPKLRSERWVSTSVPQDRWNEEMAKYSSAEYHTNNLLNPVLFEESARLIPKNAVLVEVAPHGLLQAILKRALPTCAHVPLTRRGHPDISRFLLEAIGQLFMEGHYPDIRHLYPKVEFPVSTGTPHLSHLVEWAHQQKWHLALYASPERKSASTCTFKITLHDAEYAYLRGHRIGGKTLFPFSSALVCAWDTLTMVARAPRRGLPVEFRDVELYSQPTLHDLRLLRLTVALHRGNGRFEIDDGITKVASGFIVLKNTVKSESIEYEELKEDILKTEDIYQTLYERGYMYREEFQGIREMNGSYSAGSVSWTGRWEPFLDALLQLNIIRQTHDYVSRPAFIRAITINTDLHTKSIQINKDLTFKVCAVQDHTRCGGVTLKGIKFRHIAKPDAGSFVFDTSKFDNRYQPQNGLNDKSGYNSQDEKMLQSRKVGDLNTLHWVTAPASESNGILVKVHFAGLNASDILAANEPFVNKQTNFEGFYGMDFSGTLQNGSRVMGLLRGGSTRSHVRARPELLWPVPAHWTLEDAATVPLPFAHALYCLAIKTRLMPRSKILVSGGAGATGQAIIAMALHLDCRVFVVVGDAAKKKFLMKMFPKLDAEDIICCRDDTFMNRVLPATGGWGCEYVICGRGDHKDAYLQCCTHFGYTLDIHQVKNNEVYSFRMGALTKERSYIRVDFSSLFLHNDIETFKRLRHLVAEGISGGWVRPLSRVVYAPSDATRAFRLLARSRHRGRVMLRVHDLPTSLVEPRLTCSKAYCQLVIGDSSGLAMCLASCLVQRGARALHLQLAHIGPRLSRQLLSWRKLGVNAITTSLDLAQNDCASNLLKLSSGLGPVEGIFIVMAEQQTGQTQALYKSLLADLDAETRKVCPSIKYFAVIGINTSVGKDICVSRAAYQLPAMMLSLSMDTKVGGILPTSYGVIVNAIEQGLQTMQPVIFGRRPSDSKGSLTLQIEKITGITISENTSNMKTLQDFDLTADKIQALRVFLDNQNVTITENEVQMLSIEKLREIDATSQEENSAPIRGLSAFFPFVDSDELLATIDTVVMPTLTQGSDMRDDEFNASEACLYIVPGLQGLHQRYRALCERLQLTAVVLQPGLDHPDETLQEMTARYITMVLKKRGGTNKFYLLGHEIGVLSVLEMAAKLEDHGMTGTVFCLGGGPEQFLGELERQLLVACAGAIDSQSILQQAVARHMCALMGVASAQLDAALREAPSWQQKVDVSVRALRGRVAHSMQYARLLIEAAYARVIQALRYKRPSPRALQSRIVLLRSPIPDSPVVSPLELQNCSRMPLVVHDLRSPPAHATNDLRAAAIINRYLDEETKQCFASKTLCNTYLMNPESFIGIGEFEEGSKIKI
ncbi:fatty acid synthase-like [Cydia strobilella]|uniref:fatty acid synthase-like n=1 Tax=Cydia strobilella TaxID=1100964 RepID=UPI0030053F28